MQRSASVSRPCGNPLNSLGLLFLLAVKACNSFFHMLLQQLLSLPLQFMLQEDQ